MGDVDEKRYELLCRDVLREWFGVSDRPVLQGSEPPLLTDLRAAQAGRGIFGAQNFLVDRVIDERGIVPVIVENQSVWEIGYRPDGTTSPDVVIYDPFDATIVLELKSGLNEVLYRTTVIEAIFSHWNRNSADIPIAEIRAALGSYMTAPSIEVGDFGLPEIWSLPGLLAIGFTRRGRCSVFVGTRDQSAFERSPLPDMVRWFQWEGPSE